MSNELIAPLEPQEIDEDLAMKLRILSSDASLRNSQRLGDEQCAGCRYFLENTADISYCWHPKLRILVGSDWSCAWWEPTEV